MGPAVCGMSFLLSDADTNSLPPLVIRFDSIRHYVRSNPSPLLTFGFGVIDSAHLRFDFATGRQRSAPRLRVECSKCGLRGLSVQSNGPSRHYASFPSKSFVFCPSAVRAHLRRATCPTAVRPSALCECARHAMSSSGCASAIESCRSATKTETETETETEKGRLLPRLSECIQVDASVRSLR